MTRSQVQKRVWTTETDAGETTEQTQYIVTIPKQLAEAMDMAEGDKAIEWSIVSSSALRAEVVESDVE